MIYSAQILKRKLLMKEGFDKMQAKPFSRLESCFVKMQKARHVYTCGFLPNLFVQ